MNESEDLLGPRVIDLSGTIDAFDRLSREAGSIDPHSFASLFLAQTVDLLREVQRGRIVTEEEWFASFEASRLVIENRRKSDA